VATTRKSKKRKTKSKPKRTAKTFIPRKGARLTKRDAVIVGQELEKLNQRHGGLTAEVVVGEASRTRSKLHRFFEWDDDEAAEQWRLHQARVLIKSVRVVLDPDDDEGPREIAAFIHVRRDVDNDEDDDEEEAVYLTSVEVMSDAKLRRQVLKRALRELESWQRRYNEYEEFAAIFSELDRVRKRIKKAA
jgi:hypothetical protein